MDVNEDNLEFDSDLIENNNKLPMQLGLRITPGERKSSLIEILPRVIRNI